ncbi:MAG TPA: GNAT family N-acetyltransferase [Ignavibacteria bacterium]|nr:GNAT family N-acetyltransferase [Ignavibacteria bacterium]HMR40793.1 GNAT family N-acetyltransferase [Ignavibacteria bacterium]
MKITLRKINEDNWRECIALKVSNDQKKFVASNENGLALAYAHKEMQPLAVYADDEMAGFIMYAKDPDDGMYYINRFMIDEKYQGKGYGEKALCILLKDLKVNGVASVDIIHKPDNEVAVKLYKKLGFKLTDEKSGDDVISKLIFF